MTAVKLKIKLCTYVYSQPAVTVHSASSWIPANCECPCETQTVWGVLEITYASMLFTMRLVFVATIEK